LSISVHELTKAVSSLEEALTLFANAAPDSIEKKAFRDACIQRFEFSVELAWKVSVKVMGANTTAAKIAVREMARNNLIPDPQVWFDFIEARNETSHSYDENVAKKILEVAKKFPPEAHKLLIELTAK
jgi:nucleotidyltransferase substrate binding protein (TIGR01987 family)